jgi:hypothetical protein
MILIGIAPYRGSPTIAVGTTRITYDDLSPDAAARGLPHSADIGDAKQVRRDEWRIRLSSRAGSSETPDPVTGLRASDACWCRSGRLHGACHGCREPASEPGAPITAADDGDRVFITPGRSVDRAWLASCIPGLPVYAPSVEPVVRPVIVPEIVARMTAPPTHTTPSLAELGQHRFTALDSLGLDNPDQLASRLARLTDSDMADLRYFLIDVAKTTIDVLTVQQQAPPGPVLIWAGDADPVAMVGGTLLWADHYLVGDGACETAIASSRPQDLEGDLRELLRLRPLVETGMVVPVLEQAAALLADDAARRRTEVDLHRPDLTEWVDSQLVMEGPTARECLLFTAVDDDEEVAAFFMWAPILSVDAEHRFTTSRLLGPYRAGEDYGPWIIQSRQETVKNLIHNVSKHVAIADAFGADWLTTSPFKQRLLQRRGDEPPGAQALIRADVPQLSAASAVALARVAAEEEAVEALREATREALYAMRTLSPADQRSEAAELGRQLQARSRELRRDMTRTRRWKRDIPGALSVASGAAALASVAIGAAGPAAGLIDLCAGLAGLFGLGSAVGPYRADRAAHRANPAFALLLGDGLVLPRNPTGERTPARVTLKDVLFSR